jgi:hypothetical protein
MREHTTEVFVEAIRPVNEDSSHQTELLKGEEPAVKPVKIMICDGASGNFLPYRTYLS